MKPAAVIYATRDGHTRRIADAIARGLGKHGVASTLIDLSERPAADGLDAFDSAVVAAPVRMGRHPRQIEAFVKQHSAALARMPSAFVSVSLSEAGVQRVESTPVRRAKFASYLGRCNERFYKRTGWHPAHVKNVAGALAYSHYGMVLRLAMRYFARRCGGSTDTTHDYEYTDWGALDGFVATWSQEILAPRR